MSELHIDRTDDGPRAHASGARQTLDAAPSNAVSTDDADAPDRAVKRRESHWLSFVLVAAAVVVLDQITKRYIDATLAVGESWPDAGWPFRIMHVKNTGAAFSMLQDQTLFLTVMSVVGLGAILLYFLFRPSDHPLLRYALALQLGGAIGNLIDRALYGEVTDFFKIPNWPVFNVADSAISVGVVTVILFLLFAKDGSRQPAPDR
jgi:signal peptidase II